MTRRFTPAFIKPKSVIRSLSVLSFLVLSACATTSTPAPISGTGNGSGQVGSNGSNSNGQNTASGQGVSQNPYSDGSNEIIAANPNPRPVTASIPKAPLTQSDAPPASSPAPEIIIPVYQSPLTALPYWNTGNHGPALSAFKNSCVRWADTNATDRVSQHLPEYGTFADWRQACELAALLPDTPAAAKQFFEREFVPVRPKTRNKETGLLTGYYQPEIDVRLFPTTEFSEPILAKPTSKSDQSKPRSAINAKTSRVIAYGRPMDVFFMQIQGSGHIRFENGRSVRAAYNGNNGHAYNSIGRVLINRGQLTKDRSSKRDIENWMQKNGPKKSREVMNQNKRYIFFVEQAIKEGEGPMGAMRVPLSAMGSIAVDPRYHPYGVPSYLIVKLPQTAGDYRGTEQGQLVVAQDTGKAIRGALRADLYFGSGDAAGSLAGVMKHNASWMILLPRALVERRSPVT